mmetsp:Transcript_131/g.470  ORF Transcript_131/g.470 Transcript_131/m.470 type:complete len:555 (+) Transcript_131:90-1754(+)
MFWLLPLVVWWWSSSSKVVRAAAPYEVFEVPSFETRAVPLPPGLVVDRYVDLHLSLIEGTIAPLSKYELPIALRLVSFVDQMIWNCAASYHDEWLDAVTRERPLTAVPEVSLHSTDARILCSAFAIRASYVDVLGLSLTEDVPVFLETFVPKLLNFSDVGFPADLKAFGGCSDDEGATACALDEYVASKGYAPAAVGAAVAYDLLRRFASDDGWNAEGALGTDGRACTANCLPYQDTSDYEPSAGTCGRTPEGWCWEPLREHDGRGFFLRHEHVVPHVGRRARTKVVDRDDYSLELPPYDYAFEEELALDRSRFLDDAKKAAIEFFNDKTRISESLLGALIAKYGGGDEEKGGSFTHERLAWYSMVYTTAEYDAVIVAWKEKVRHSLVRPTSVIRDYDRNNSETVEAYAGPFRGVRAITKRDWQPYIRVMPHAEYPSGTGCICICIEQLAAKALDFLFGPGTVANDTDAATLSVGVFVPQGSSTVEPGATPQNDILLFYPTLRDMRLACGESRLDGGMHFTHAVNDSYTLCDGIGPAVVDYAKLLVQNNTSSFP